LPLGFTFFVRVSCGFCVADLLYFVVVHSLKFDSTRITFRTFPRLDHFLPSTLYPLFYCRSSKAIIASTQLLTARLAPPSPLRSPLYTAAVTIPITIT
jgi:hypothetical protein